MSAEVTPSDQVMIAFALKLTETPGQVEKADADRLRRAGFDDLAIHDIVCCVAYFAYVNRVADGLGVELE